MINKPPDYCKKISKTNGHSDFSKNLKPERAVAPQKSHSFQTKSVNFRMLLTVDDENMIQ